MDEVWQFLGRFHPVVLHLPIGVLIGVFLLELVTLLREPQKLRLAIGVLLGFGAISALTAMTLGLMLASGGGYDEDTLFWHKYLGISVAVGAVLSATLHYLYERLNKNPKLYYAYRIVLTVTVVCLTIGGHFGGTLTHGSGYLTKYLPDWFQPESPQLTAVELAAVSEIELGFYRTKIQPIFKERCYECHGPEKQKGDLRLDRKAGALGKGESGEMAILPGEATKSEVIRRIMLPQEHDDAMPQKGKMLTDAEILLLVRWINDGARFEPPVPPPNPSIMLAFQEIGVLALPLAAERNEVRVDFSHTDQTVESFHLQALRDHLSQQLVWLNLAGLEVADTDWAVLKALKNLTRLHLEKTTITDVALAYVTELEHLEYLNLYGTKISDRGLKHLAGLENLKKLYLWQTQVSDQGVAELKTSLPGVEIVLGAKLVLVVDAATDAAGTSNKNGQLAGLKFQLTDLFDKGSCCSKAHQAGKKCSHACCKKELSASKVCAKCNPGAEKKRQELEKKLAKKPEKTKQPSAQVVLWRQLSRFFDKDSCCFMARKAGKRCGHACCKKEFSAGKVCLKCNLGAEEKQKKLDGVNKGQTVIMVDSENDANRTEKDGSWTSGGGGGDHAGSTLWALQGNGDSRFRWRPKLPNAGRYRVSAWYGGDPNGDHASDAPFTVHYDGGKQTHKLDQTRDSGGWRVLGSYRFKVGTAGYVELTNAADGNVVADAVRFERLK